MKEIIKKNVLCASVLSAQQYDRQKKYRFIKYVIEYPYDNGHLLLNTLTLQMFHIETKVFDMLFKNEYCTEMETLVNNYFLVPNDFDDKKFKNEIMSLVYSFNTPEKDYTHFTIMPTMDCNARCFYCFEHGSKRHSMTEQTAVDVANFIEKKSNGKNISIQWFGGEPLYNEKIIDVISNALLSKNISFKSRMITNGYLFDEINIEKSKNIWNLKYVQITLDGTEEIYNRTKAYIYKTQESPFIRILNNIEMLLKNNINVLIRLNMDHHNKDDLYKLIDILDKRFKKYNDILSIYVWLLYDSRLKIKNKRSHEEKSALMKALLSIENYINSKGFSLKSEFKNEYKLYSCIADSDIAVTILPDGNIGKCDHYSDERFIGNIYTDNVDNNEINYWKLRRPNIPLCEECPISPQCIKLSNCPEEGECDTIEQKYAINQYYNRMRNSYKKKTGD